MLLITRYWRDDAGKRKRVRDWIPYQERNDKEIEEWIPAPEIGFMLSGELERGELTRGETG